MDRKTLLEYDVIGGCVLRLKTDLDGLKAGTIITDAYFDMELFQDYKEGNPFPCYFAYELSSGIYYWADIDQCELLFMPLELDDLYTGMKFKCTDISRDYSVDYNDGVYILQINNCWSPDTERYSLVREDGTGFYTKGTINNILDCINSCKWVYFAPMYGSDKQEPEIKIDLSDDYAQEGLMNFEHIVNRACCGDVYESKGRAIEVFENKYGRASLKIINKDTNSIICVIDLEATQWNKTGNTRVAKVECGEGVFSVNMPELCTAKENDIISVFTSSNSIYHYGIILEINDKPSSTLPDAEFVRYIGRARGDE